MVFRLISLWMFVTLISGCVTAVSPGLTTPTDSQVNTFADTYRKAKQARKTVADDLPLLSLDVPTGFTKPYMPVILPPRVIKVWVPAHVLKEDRRIMVSGHWSFVMLEGTHWFIEGEVRRWH